MTKEKECRAETTAHSDSNKRNRVTQEDIVLRHLRRYGSITSMTAFREYNITRLSAKIYNLRHSGYQIGMTRETSKSGKNYGRYFLREEETA